MLEMNVDAYRFSIAWSRIMKYGKQPVSCKLVKHQIFLFLLCPPDEYPWELLMISISTLLGLIDWTYTWVSNACNPFDMDFICERNHISGTKWNVILHNSCRSWPCLGQCILLIWFLDQFEHAFKLNYGAFVCLFDCRWTKLWGEQGWNSLLQQPHRWPSEEGCISKHHYSRLR